jgi:hypothetical protein
MQSVKFSLFSPFSNRHQNNGIRGSDAESLSFAVHCGCSSAAHTSEPISSGISSICVE